MTTPVDIIQEYIKTNNLDGMRDLARSQGVKFHHNAGVKTLGQAVLDAITQVPAQTELKHPAAQPAPVEAHIHTEAEVRERCAKWFNKEGYVAKFENDTWHFKYKGAEDSGHMSAAMRVIMMKAENVSLGARVMRVGRGNDWGSYVDGTGRSIPVLT